MKKILIILLFAASLGVKAQTFQFSNTTPPKNFGYYTISNAMTFSLTYTSDTGANRFRGSMMGELGNIQFYVGYPYLVFNSGGDNWNILLTGSIGYTTMFNRKPHKFTFRIGDGKKEVLLGNTIIASKQYSGNIAQSASLWISSSSDIDRLSGSVSGVTFAAAYITQRNEVVMPIGEQDLRNLPPGYTTGHFDNVPLVIDQLKSMTPPPYANKMPKIRIKFNMRNLGGWLDSTVPKDTAIKRAVEIADYLCKNFNTTLMVIDNTQDLWDYYTQPASYQNKFNMAMIALANAHPEYEIEIGMGLAQIHDSRNGWKVLTDAQYKNMYPNEPVSTFEGNRQVVKEQLQLAKSLLTRPVNYLSWDNEVYNDYIDTTRYAANIACLQAKQASGLSWYDYCSRRYTDDVLYTMQDVQSIMPGVQQSEYDVNALDACNQHYFAKFKYRSELNYMGWGSGQVYPLSARSALYGYSTNRGFMNYTQVDLKGYNEKGGPARFIPWLQPGSSGVPELTMTPTAATGLATLLFGAGAYTIQPAVFYDLGLAPDPKSLAWQLVYCSYAQASFSKHPDILLKGVLLDGDHSMEWSCFGANDHTFWTGDKECPAEVLMYGDELFITTSRQFLSNTRPINGSYRATGIGIYLYLPHPEVSFMMPQAMKTFIPLVGAPMGSVFYLNTKKPIVAGVNPKLEDGWKQFGDFQNWNRPELIPFNETITTE